MVPEYFALIASVVTSLALGATAASAEQGRHHGHKDEHRQYGTHVHGIAALNVALEGPEVQIELDSPAASIVGFEHAPSSAGDHAALDKAVATLKAGDRLFAFNDAAGCRMETATVTSELLEDGHEGHGDGEDGTHSDIEAVYHFECAQPGKLNQLTVELFEAFPGMEKLNVQYVMESKQGAAQLSAANHSIKF